jgi:hypothetical protein
MGRIDEFVENISIVQLLEQGCGKIEGDPLAIVIASNKVDYTLISPRYESETQETQFSVQSQRGD